LIDPSKSQVIFAGAASLSACIACVYDLRERRIPNWLTGPLFLAGVLARACAGNWKGLFEALTAALFGGMLFLMFYVAGGLGAGDVKLMGACASIVGLSALPTLLICTGIFGALLAVCVSLVRGVFKQSLKNTCEVLAHHRIHGLTPHPEINLGSGTGIRLPFALPIAAGCLFTLATLVAHR